MARLFSTSPKLINKSIKQIESCFSVNIDPLQILLIEDEIAHADWIDAILDDKDFPAVEIEHVERLQEAIVCLSQKNFDVILLDLSLPDSQGIDSIVQVKQQTSSLPIVVLTNLNDQNIALKALRQGVQDYLIKGKFTGELLIRSIRYAIERQRTEVTLRQQALMKKMLDRIRQSLDLKEILSNTVAEVRQFLKTDRVLIYRCENHKSGEIMVESIESSQDQLFPIQFAGGIDFFQLHSFFAPLASVQAIEDVKDAPQKDICALAEYQIRSLLTLAIWRSSVVEESLDTTAYLAHKIDDNTDIDFNNSSILTDDHQLTSKEAIRDRLWGMLVAHNCYTPRQWQDWEIEFLQQLTIQVTIAIQQSELYRKLQDANQKLEKLAILDGLTGVANRRYFDCVLNNEWQRLAREQKPLSLILSDIDYFKLYNDTYGHPAGDRCLQAVAKVLKTAIRRPADLVARYGGEEFAVILPDTDAQGALFVANKIRHKLAELKFAHQKSGIGKYLTLSIGVVTQTPQYNVSPHTLIDKTDNLLYQAKRKGRDCIINTDLDRIT